jgi:plasmid stabilization system protein ParE
MDALRDTMKGLIGSTVLTRERGDLRPGILMATSGRHSIFFETDDARVLVVRVLHDRMDYRRHLDPDAIS